MRNLTDHIVSGDQAVQLGIEVIDNPGPGGAHHDYRITGKLTPESETEVYARVEFQKGPIKEVGVNGITNEALLAIVIDRLRCFQDGPFRCPENAIALTHIEESLMWLQRRTLERIKRGVEGTNQQ